MKGLHEYPGRGWRRLPTGKWALQNTRSRKATGIVVEAGTPAKEMNRLAEISLRLIDNPDDIEAPLTITVLR